MCHWTMGLDSDKTSKVFCINICCFLFAVFVYFLYYSGTISSKLWMFLISTSHKTRTFTVRLQSVSQSVSQWNAWPTTGRSTLQDLWSCAILQASLALSPVSSSICCTYVWQGRPRWRFHSSTPAWCPVYRLCERPQPGVVQSGLVSLPVVAARDQNWRVASDKSGLLSLLRQFG